MNDPLVQHETAVKEIFTYERLPAILAVIDSLRPVYGNFIKEDQFKTLVYAAQVDAIDSLKTGILSFVMSNNNLPQLPTHG